MRAVGDAGHEAYVVAAPGREDAVADDVGAEARRAGAPAVQRRGELPHAEHVEVVRPEPGEGRLELVGEEVARVPREQAPEAPRERGLALPMAVSATPNGLASLTTRF